VRTDTPGVRVLPVGFERHLLCGVANRRNEGVGLALIMHLDFTRETITLCTPVAAVQIKVVQFGTLYVQADGRELGYQVPRGLFA
jgi:polynucleotide 5'-kinase involved in rRNA processing